MKNKFRALVAEWIVFSCLWAQYVYVFSSFRLPGECEKLGLCQFKASLPYGVQAVLVFGLWVPVVASFVAGLFIYENGFLERAGSIVLSLVGYFVSVVALEFLIVGSGSKKAMFISLMLLPVLTVFGRIVGAIVNRFVDAVLDKEGC